MAAADYLDEQVQVGRGNYRFSTYWTPSRWMSLWYQIGGILDTGAERILEVGPGVGVLKALGPLFGFSVETVDIAADLQPDHLASVTDLPFDDNTYGCVCAFQILEHLPFEKARAGLAEMLRVSSDTVLISLPDVRPRWRFRLHVPFHGGVRFAMPRPFFRGPETPSEPQHHWELNMKGYEPRETLRALLPAHVRVAGDHIPFENPFHHFFVLQKVR